MDMMEAKMADLSRAHWITVPDAHLYEKNSRPDILTAYFRLRFQASRKDELVISISASSRYRLWINGHHVVFGPCKGDNWRQYYETIDLSDHLVDGDNVLAAKVIAYPPFESSVGRAQGPTWIMSKAMGPCLFLAGELVDTEGGKRRDLSTGNAAWRVCLDKAVGWDPFSSSCPM